VIVHVFVSESKEVLIDAGQLCDKLIESASGSDHTIENVIGSQTLTVVSATSDDVITGALFVLITSTSIGIVVDKSFQSSTSIYAHVNNHEDVYERVQVIS